MSMTCPSLSFLITFDWKLILSNIRMATPTCILGPFAWKIAFQPFTGKEFYFTGKCLSLTLRCVSCMQQNAGSWLSIQSISLCFFIFFLNWGVESIMLGDINEKWMLLPVIIVVIGGLMFVWLSSFGFVERQLSCFF